MGDWLDGLARRAAQRTSPPPGNVPTAPDRLSRRQLLKRVGVVAGAAWTVPLIQSAVAPAAAASGTMGSSPYGAPCSSNLDCASGYCINGICGQPGVFWAGSSCVKNADCWSGICRGGKCKPGPLGQVCATAADCQNNISCAAGNQTCGGAGATCQNKNKCATGLSCVHGVCV